MRAATSIVLFGADTVRSSASILVSAPKNLCEDLKLVIDRQGSLGPKAAFLREKIGKLPPREILSQAVCGEAGGERQALAFIHSHHSDFHTAAYAIADVLGEILEFAGQRPSAVNNRLLRQAMLELRDRMLQPEICGGVAPQAFENRLSSALLSTEARHSVLQGRAGLGHTVLCIRFMLEGLRRCSEHPAFPNNWVENSTPSFRSTKAAWLNLFVVILASVVSPILSVRYTGGVYKGIIAGFVELYVAGVVEAKWKTGLRFARPNVV